MNDAVAALPPYRSTVPLAVAKAAMGCRLLGMAVSPNPRLRHVIFVDFSVQ